MSDYVIAFSSFYKAVYAQEKLRERGIKALLKKTPADMLKSCGYALYLNANHLEDAKEILGNSQIDWRGIYRSEKGRK